MRSHLPKVRDVVDLAVLRVHQMPGSYDPARLYLELDRNHRIEIVRRIIAEMPPGWAAGTKGSTRFARFVCHLAEGSPAVVVNRPDARAIQPQ